MRRTIRPGGNLVEAPASLAIYDGLTLLGYVCKLSGCGWKAVDADGRRLGQYPNSPAASDRVLAAAKERPAAT